MSPNRRPPGDLDARDFSVRRPPGRRAGGGADAAELDLSGGRRAAVVAEHRFTGSPACVRPRGEAPSAGASPVARALAYVRDLTAALAGRNEVLEWVPDPTLYVTAAGRRVVHLHQQYRGIPVFEAMRTVIFAADSHADGALHEVLGDHVALPDGLPLEPELGAADAVLAACRHLRGAVEAAGHRLTDHPPRTLATPHLPATPSLLHKLPFEDPVTAYLTYFDLGRAARLSWFVTLRLPGTDGSWQLLVDAGGGEAGRVLWSRGLVSTARPARGDVWRYGPDDGADGLQRQEFPCTLADLPSARPRRPLPHDFPRLWVADRGTSGINVRARPADGRIVRGSLSGGSITFAPGDATGTEQQCVNAFYWCNRVHDVLYLLGFDEAEGNFQEHNPGGEPRAGDRLEVEISERVLGDASLLPAEDGKPPQLLLGITRAGRPTALSADVVYHECIHGLTNRLVGGHKVAHPMAQSTQSRALDEGTCDWFALTLQNHERLGERPPRPEKRVFGAWVADDPERGMRAYSYADYPLRFGDLAGHPDLADFHDAGQVWGTALFEMNRHLGDLLGDRRHGHEVGWQAMVDALRETARTPLSITYLHTRDRLLEAVTALAAAPPPRADGTPLLPPELGAEARSAVAAAFSGLGMGPEASGDDPGFADVVADPA